MNSPRLIKVVALSFALAALGAAGTACRGSKAEAEKKNQPAQAAQQPAVVEVTTAAAISRDLPQYFEATGSLTADEQTDVAPAVGGKVVAVNVDLGSYVQKGAVLLRLDDRDARIRLEQAQAQLAQQQSTVRQAEERIGLRSGQAFDPSRVAEVRSARAALDLAETNMRRFERLIESGDVSRSAYDQQKAQRDQLQQQYEAQLNLARQNYAGVQTARAGVEAAKAQISQARKAIADAVVMAPISGYVAERNADLGEYLTTSSKAVTIVRVNPLRIRIDIPEQAIEAVQVGQSVSLSVSALPDRAFAGKVARVSPNVTPTSRTLTIEAEVDNGAGVLKPGQFATVRILLPKSQPAILVPQRAVRSEAGVNRVFVIKDGYAQQRLIQLGRTDGDLVEIRSGVGSGEQVAISNIEQLSDGTAVRQ